MANTLTNLLPTLVKGFDVVSRELVGFIPSVTRDATTDRVAKNQTLYSWKTAAASLNNITAANVSPQAADNSVSNVSITVTNFKMSDFYLTGEEKLGLDGNYGPLVADLTEQCIRVITNQMESDIYSAAYVGASRAWGTAGTTPFASTINASAKARKILDDNGAPFGQRSLVIDSSAGANLRTLQQLTRVNESGTTMGLRDGELLNLNGFSVKESAQITAPTVGTGASYTTDGSAYAVGATALTLITGSGTILAGDVITISGDTTDDTHQYVVASALSGGVVTIAAPGLKKAIPASAKAVTVIAAATRNLAFSRNAIVFAARLPAAPDKDLASEVEVITDPRSGIALEVRVYPQYRQTRVELAAAWNAVVVKPEHIGTVLG